jgi:hypothetical protein
MVDSGTSQVRQQVGVVGAYAGGAGIAVVRQVRDVVGRVTVSGKTGLKVLAELEKNEGVGGVDFDPAKYKDRDEPELFLLEEDWTSRQRDLDLPVIRSQGRYVDKGDDQGLKLAFAEVLPSDVVRVISLHASWLRTPWLDSLLAAVEANDSPLAFVLADAMDPLASPSAVEGLLRLTASASSGGRRVELLRTDLAGIGFAAHGGARGTIGLGTSNRHHGLGMNLKQQDDYKARQRWPLVLNRPLMSWQRGSSLGALTEFDGAGITDCPCEPCDGRNLLRFDESWPTSVPAPVKLDVLAHDMATWALLAREILDAEDPAQAWAYACAEAHRTAQRIALAYRVSFKVPASLTAWD